MQPFIGIIIIVLGLALLIFGARFVLYTFAALVFLGTSCVLFNIVYKVLPQDSTTNVVLIVVLVLSILIGVAVAFVTYKFGEQWGTCIIGIGAGVFLALLILVAAKVT